MDGMEATQEIRKLGEKYEKLPIIALTANAVSGMREMFLANGFNGFISKPIAVQELDKILREWLSLEKFIHKSEAETAGAAGNADDAFDNFIVELSKIEEINTEIGLSRFPGMKEIYRITAEMFYKKLLSECDNMTGFLAAEDLESFAISIHAMKSSLATVGAMRLSEIASELETSSKNRDINFCQETFPQLREKLLSLQKKLSVIFDGGTGDSPEKEPGDMNSLREEAKKALAAAEAFDDDTCTEIIKNLLPYDFGGEINDLLENALTALENFDFEGATGTLRKIE
jgi:HPt (histidine-containing phosphotransfer) domain-containing protein